MDPKLRAIAERLNKKLGEGTVVLGSDIRPNMVQRCTTGSLALDLALGGGWPMNQWAEIVGYESAGKTVVALKTLAANQARDPKWNAVWIDAERSWDPDWAAQLGVDAKRVMVMTENGMETVYGAAIEFLGSKEVDCIVIDSLPALVPEREDEASMEDLQVGLGALLTGKFFRKQQPATRRSLVAAERPVLGLLINQWRDRIGVVYGDPRTTPGGRAKNYFAAVRIEVKRDEWIEEADERVGQVLKINVIKNKTAVPHKVAVLDFYFQQAGPMPQGSYDRVKEVVAVALIRGVIARSGSWYLLGEEKYQGQKALVQALREEVDLLHRVEHEVLQVVYKRQPRLIKRR